MERLPGLEENILREIFRFIPVSEQSDRRPVNLRQQGQRCPLEFLPRGHPGIKLAQAAISSL
jgi:hypothetical protein